MMMRSLLFLLLACLVLMAGDADAELDTRNEEWSFYSTGHRLSIDISADGEHIAVGSGNGKVYLFGKDDHSPIWNYETGGEVNSVAISGNGKHIAASSSDGNVYLFSKNSNTPLWNYTIECGSSLNCLHPVGISANGKYIAAGSRYPDSKVYLFDKDSGTPLWSYTVGEEVVSVVISSDGDYIAAGSADGRIYLFDKNSSTPVWIYDEGLELSLSDESFHISISANGENVVAGMSVDFNCSFYVFNKNSNIPLWNYAAESSSNKWCPVSISADGDYIAAGSGKKFYLFDKDGSKPLWDYATDGSYVMSVAISGNGYYIVAGSSGSSIKGNEDGIGKVYLFNRGDDTPLWYSNISFGSIKSNTYVEYRSVGISADGEYIVSSNGDVKFFTREDNVLGFLSEFLGEVGFNSLVVLAILAGLFQFRKDTGTENATNKVFRIALYGISIVLLLYSIIIFSIVSAFEEGINGAIMWLYFLLFAILFAVTGTFLGHETYDPGPSYSYKSSIPPSKPIFSDRRETPMFPPENELTTIECPGCSAQMEVPILGAMQKVICDECGTSGEIEI